MTSPSAFPRTRAEALAMRAWYRCRWRELHAAAELAARKAEMAKGELAVVESMCRGEFDMDSEAA